MKMSFDALKSFANIKQHGKENIADHRDRLKARFDVMNEQLKLVLHHIVRQKDSDHLVKSSSTEKSLKDVKPKRPSAHTLLENADGKRHECRKGWRLAIVA